MPQRYRTGPIVQTHELEAMKLDFPQVIEGDWYDVKSLTTTPDGDGGVVSGSTLIETILIDVQPIQWSQREGKNRVEVEIGGIKYLPSLYGFTQEDVKATASNYLTKDSGTINLIVLRTYAYEDHIEMDLVEAEG